MISPVLAPRSFAVPSPGSIRWLAARLCFRSLVIGCLSDQLWICLTAWLPIPLDALRPGIPPGRILETLASAANMLVRSIQFSETRSYPIVYCS